MNLEKRQKLEEAGWRVGSAEEFLGLTEGEKLKLNTLVENTKYLEKWGIDKVTLEHLSQDTRLPTILKQYREIYPKLSDIVDSYLKDKALLSQVTNSGHAERVTTQTIKYKNYYGAMEVDVETDTIYGRVIYIQDLITFKAETVKQAKIEFAKSVDDYLEFCQELNREPS